MEQTLCYSRFDPRWSRLANGPRRKLVYGASQCGLAGEVLCVRSWSEDGLQSFFSSHFPYCTPTHWYILFLACWASCGLLWPIHSLSLAYIFSPGLEAYPYALCIYWLDLWVSWALCHCSCVLSLVIHGFFFRPLCIFISSAFEFCFYHLNSIRFYFLLCDDDTLLSRSYRSGVTGQACHTLHSTCRLWSRILRLREDHLGWEVWGLRFFWLDYASVAFN